MSILQMSALRIVVLIVLSVTCLTPESVSAAKVARQLKAVQRTIATLSESLVELVDSDNVTKAVLNEMNLTIHDMQRAIETLSRSQDAFENADEVTDARQNEMNSSIQDLKQEFQVWSAAIDTLSEELNSVLETMAVTEANLNRMNTNLAQHLAQENGHWNSWGSWSSCVGTCGIPGLSQRQRTCSTSSGRGCIGDSTMQRICYRTNCEYQVRLVNGGHRSGRVEIMYGGIWGTICDDSWDNNDARVVCRMLGYSGGTAYGSAHFGQGTGRITLDDVHCTGTESTLTSCRLSSWLSHNCGHGEDAGVACT